jgi:hypothetical protein
MAKYDPSRDVVAGRTAKQIEAAKRRAIGGSKKRCNKGKSCGATCINQGKVCLVDLPWVSSNGLTRVATKIQSATTKDRGEGVKFSPLGTTDDFLNLVSATQNLKNRDRKLVEDNAEVAKLLDVKGYGFPLWYSKELYKNSEEEAKYGKLREQIGKSVVNDGFYALETYTGSLKEARLIRLADRDPSKSSEEYRQASNDLNRLLTLREMPRPDVEKFRGFRATPEKLQEMIDGSKGKEKFNHATSYSWSSALGIGREFADKEIYEAKDRTERVIFRSVNKRGVPIEFVSSVSKEDELLTPRNTNYKYLGYRPINVYGYTYHVFDVEEFS